MASSIHPVDLAIFVAFLLATLVVGLSYGRQVRTIQDYALGGKNFSTTALTATIAATWFGGGSLYYGLANMYSQGLSFFIAFLGSPLCLLIVGRVLAVRMKEFLNNVSPAEAMGDMYGKRIQIISGISGIVVQLGYVAMQFRVISNILNLFWGVQDEWITLVAAAIVILYSMMGGIRAVTFTDVVQFFTFGTFIPMLALIVWSNLQNPQQVAAVLANNPKFHLREVVGWNTGFASTIALMLYYTTHGVNPVVFQRVSMARNIKQARRAFTYSAFIAVLVNLCIAWIAVLLLAKDPNLDPNKLVNYLIDNHTYVGFQGLLVTSIVALAMSTADSCINSAAVFFANDLAAPLGFNTTKTTLTARIFSLVGGLLALLLALYEKDLLSLLLLIGNFYLPIVSMPLFSAIFGFRSSKRAVLIGMAAGFTTVILWRNFLAHTGIDSVMPASLSSLLFLLGSHYLLGEPGGWQKVAPESPLGLERAARKEAWKRRLQAIKDFKLYPYLQQNLPQQEGLYSLFGFYAIMATYGALYAIEPVDVKAYNTIYEGIVHTGFFATTAFLTFPIWPPTVKRHRFIIFLWPLGIAALLFFAGTLIAIMSHFHPMQMIVLMINLLIAVLLLHGPLAIILVVSGVSLAVSFFHYYTGEAPPWSGLFISQYRSLYGLVLLSCFLIVLFRYQQNYQQLGKKNQVLQSLGEDQQANLLQVAAEKQDALKALQYTGVERLLTVSKQLHELEVKPSDRAKLQAIKETLIPMAFQLQGIDIRARDYLRLKIEEDWLIEQLFSTVRARLREKGLEPHIHYKRNTQHQMLTCDPEQLSSLLTQSIALLTQPSQDQQEDEEKQSILLALEDTWLHYPLPDVAKGYIKQVQALGIGIATANHLPPLADHYAPNLTNTASPTPETTQALDQLANERIIKAHYGYADVSNHTLVYVVPVNVKEVRPKDMDKAYMEVGAPPKRANDHFKNDKGIDAQAQEQAFLSEVAARSQADIGLIKIAIELIKWYHGPVDRHSGEPFYLHPLAVAQIVLDYNQDEVTILDALLHDTVEDTCMLLQHISTVLGPETAEVVDVVTHLQSIPGSFYKVKLSAEENLQMLERTGNKRGLYVKLADRMHNMRTISGHSSLAKQKQVAEETARFFVPLAEQLGLQAATAEFKERCLEVFSRKR